MEERGQKIRSHWKREAGGEEKTRAREAAASATGSNNAGPSRTRTLCGVPPSPRGLPAWEAARPPAARVGSPPAGLVPVTH